jgi:hypothetical protein
MTHFCFLYMFLVNQRFIFPNFLLCRLLQRSARSQVSSQVATHQEIGSQLRAGEMPDLNRGLQDNSLACYLWATMPPTLSYHASRIELPCLPTLSHHASHVWKIKGHLDLVDKKRVTFFNNDAFSADCSVPGQPCLHRWNSTYTWAGTPGVSNEDTWNGR